MIENIYIVYTIVIIASYLIGSIPFGLVLGGLFKVGDIRNIGSGNIGATNALRTGNKGFALAVLLCDGVKGVVAILLTQWLFRDVCECLPMVAGLVAVLGHMFPVWLRFKGGKGVATGLGVILVLSFPTGLCVAAMWLLTAKLSRTSSLAAVLGFLHAPVYAMANGLDDFYVLGFAGLGLLVILKHNENIKRLLKGTEPIIGQKV